MKVSLSWLSELIELPKNLTPEELHEDLVRVGFEEESIQTFGVSGPVVVGEVISREPEEHSNGKTVNWCQVRVAKEGEKAADGGADVRGIVCGAHNFEAGDKVVVTLPGAVLPGDFQIAARKTYGHVSDGMIASQRELGLGEDHDGIIVLSRMGLDPEVGSDAIELLGLSDSAVEINVTPDRGYAFSLRGIARELSHSTGATFIDPATKVKINPASGFDVKVIDENPIRGEIGCSGFITRLVRGVDRQAPTPAWMVARLQLAGIRSLSLVVDISNYVMLELGNPLHAYDFNKLQGSITVRRAKAGEELKTLDGQTRKLDVEDLLITDESGPIGLAGVMGGESTKTDTGTSDVLIEAAIFDPVSIARTSRRHKLPSEASKRFERGVDPLVSKAAASRMAELLIELAGGELDSLGSDFEAPFEPLKIALNVNDPAALVGAEYTPEDVIDSLKLIGCEVVVDGDQLSVEPPSWRSDLTRKEDLIEEVARIVGYDKIPSVLPVAPSGRGLTREQKLRRKVAESMAAAGFNEVQNYPFVSASENELFSKTAAAGIKLLNPLDGEASRLRLTMLPGLAAAAHRNVSRGQTSLKLFELGSVFLSHDNPGTETVPPLAQKPAAEVLATMQNSIPEQPLMAAGFMVGNAWAKQPNLPSRPFDLSDALDAVKQLAHSADAKLEFSKGEHRVFHPGRTAEILMRAAATKDSDNLVSVGLVGELLPEISKDLHLPGRVYAFEINLGLIFDLAPKMPEVSGLSTYPAATQDLTLMVDYEISAGDVLNAVKSGSGELLESIRLVDDYRAEGDEKGEKALTFALTFRALDRTLTAEEASAAKMGGVAEAGRQFKAHMRD